MRAFFVIIIAITVLAAALLLLTIFQPEADLEMLLFEAVSAFATVGLTLGITPDLELASQLILIALMYIGRVGGLTLIFSALSGNKGNTARLPQEKLIVG